MIGTIDRLSTRIPSISIPIPRIHSRGLLFLVGFALVVELYHLPDPLQVLARGGFGGIGLGRVSFILAFFFFLRLISYQPNRLSFPGSTVLVLFFGAALLSFLVNGMESSFGALLQSDSYLKTTQLIRGAGFLMIFIVFFSHYESLILFFKIVVILSSLVLISFLLGMDKALLAYLGKVPEMGVTERIYGLLFDRPTFGTMNGNTFSGIIVGVMLIAFYGLLTDTKKSQVFLYTFCAVMCLLAVIKGASRGASIMAGAGVLTLILTSIKGAGLKNKSVHVKAAFLLTLIILGVGYLLSRGALYVLSERWSQVIGNVTLKSFDFIQTYSAYDNFTVRVLTAMDALPQGMMEWLFGTGGITKGYSFHFRTGCHTDLANLLGQYGLIGFVPYMGYILFLFFYFLKKSRPGADTRISALRSLGLALIVVFLIESLFSPLFFSRWFWMGTMTSIAMIIRNDEKTVPPSRSEEMGNRRESLPSYDEARTM